MGSGAGIRQVGYFDCAGGGQVVVEDGIAAAWKVFRDLKEER